MYTALLGEVTTILPEGGHLLASMYGGSRHLTAPVLCSVLKKIRLSTPQSTLCEREDVCPLHFSKKLSGIKERLIPGMYWVYVERF